MSSYQTTCCYSLVHSIQRVVVSLQQWPLLQFLTNCLCQDSSLQEQNCTSDFTRTDTTTFKDIVCTSTHTHTHTHIMGLECYESFESFYDVFYCNGWTSWSMSYEKQQKKRVYSIILLLSAFSARFVYQSVILSVACLDGVFQVSPFKSW